VVEGNKKTRKGLQDPERIKRIKKLLNKVEIIQKIEKVSEGKLSGKKEAGQK